MNRRERRARRASTKTHHGGTEALRNTEKITGNARENGFTRALEKNSKAYHKEHREKAEVTEKIRSRARKSDQARLGLAKGQVLKARCQMPKASWEPRYFQLIVGVSGY